MTYGTRNPTQARKTFDAWPAGAGASPRVLCGMGPVKIILIEPGLALKQPSCRKQAVEVAPKTYFVNGDGMHGISPLDDAQLFVGGCVGRERGLVEVRMPT